MEQAALVGLHADQQAYQYCFIGHSQAASWRPTFQQVCEEVLPQFGLKPWYADQHYQGSVPLREKVVSMIATTSYGIYDLSSWRQNEQSVWNMPRNVLIELGMAIALNRPMLLLRHGSNREGGLPLPACLEGIEIGEFGSGKKLLEQTLRERLSLWVQHSPQQDMLNRYCHFGGLRCSWREAHPRAQSGERPTLHVHIADGADAAHVDSSDFREMIEEVLSRFHNLDFTYLDDLARPPDRPFLLCARCQQVRSSQLAIYRITPHTSADTFIAIGMSLALEKQFGCTIPKILIAETANVLPSLLWGYEIVEERSYSGMRDRLNAILPIVIKECRQSSGQAQPQPFEVFLPENNEGRKREWDAGGSAVGTAARDAGQRETPPRKEEASEQAPPSSMSRKQPVNIFIAYAHDDRDRQILAKLKIHLSPPQQQELIQVWDDGDILPGADISREIETHLKAAEIILLLVSPDFLASKFCYSKGMQWAMEQRARGTVTIIPIILRPCIWEDSPLGKLKAMPANRRPISSWSNRDDAYANVVQGILHAAKEVRSRS